MMPQPPQPRCLLAQGDAREPTDSACSCDVLAERVAWRVVELLRETVPARARLVDAQAVAAALGVARSTVYAHADELGGRTVGRGARPRLRFDLERALEAWTARDESERSKAAKPAPAGAARKRRQPAAAATAGGLPLMRVGPKRRPA